MKREEKSVSLCEIMSKLILLQHYLLQEKLLLRELSHATLYSNHLPLIESSKR